MATPLGTNTLNALTRRFIDNEIIELAYGSNPVALRLKKAGRIVPGGTHIEWPVNTEKFDSSVWFTGFDVIPPVPQDTIINAAVDWKNLAVPVTLDGTTIRKNNSPESIANIVTTQVELAQMEAEDQLGSAMWATTADPKVIDSLLFGIDNGTLAATYAGIGSRTTQNSFWQPASGALDTTTTTTTLAALQTVFQAAKEGGQHATIGITTDAIYNRLWNLLQPQQRFPVGTAAVDEQLAQAGFTNLLFNNVPVLVDSHVPAGHFVWLNENMLKLYVHPDANWRVQDWEKPVNQDAYVSTILLMCALALEDGGAFQGLLNGLTS